MITSLADLRPGDFGFGPIHGAAGLISKVGQLMLGERVRLGRVSVDHVFVVTRAADDGLPPLCVEAMPGGARMVSIEHRWTDRYAYVRPAYKSEYTGALVADYAKRMVGTPYSFLDYVALAARERHLSGWIPDSLERWVERRVTDSGHMICSQLADQAATRAGYQVFNDERLSQEVMPGEFFHRLTYSLRGEVTIPGLSVAKEHGEA